MAYQEGERAKVMSNPDMRRPIENTAQRFAALAEKLESARGTKIESPVTFLAAGDS